ncbi:MAG: YifB family Mg chelatase-like AAA ATPase [Oscillospiraceae bacterium]|nr:YifB family Mg chelatase-like AAA ATPase [Oscillospiraceae bacterium]
MFAKVNGMGLYGMNAFPVTAEISTTPGNVPAFEIVGLADASVQESRMRIRSALKNSEIGTKPFNTVVNLAPASVRKTGSLYDLTILTAVLASYDLIKINIDDCAFFGEVSLGGDVNPVHGALTLTIAAREHGIKKIFLPAANAKEAAVTEGMAVYGVNNIRELANHLMNLKTIEPHETYVPAADDFREALDFADVKGQENVKNALEVAAAGFHNILIIGTPGTGKSMLSKRLPSILPQMSFGESLETTQIHSVAGILDAKNPLVTTRPFRNVSHTASAIGLIGGGSIPMPGEISLAHNGVLFLDELPEFDRKTLETLRQPLENGEIHITRAGGKANYPCKIMLVAAMNPCPCGNYGHPTKRCSCNERQVTNYLGKISQPVLDRIDIQIEAAPVSYTEISDKAKGEPSAAVLKRVEAAREIQTRRYSGTAIKSNADIPAGMLREICALTPDATQTLKNAFDKLGLSARAYDRILKVARTIADLAASETIEKRHIARAVQYRSLDKKYWVKAN